MSSPNYTQYLRDQLQELRTVPQESPSGDIGDLCDQLSSLIDCMDALLEDAGGFPALHTGDQIKLLAFANLNQAAETLIATIHFVLEAGVVFERDKKRLAGINQVTKMSRFLKERAQYLSTCIWEGDTRQVIRLSEAAKEVWPQLVDIAAKYRITTALPEEQTLKAWLREVAPSYAKKAGRPKK